MAWKAAGTYDTEGSGVGLGFCHQHRQHRGVAYQGALSGPSSGQVNM